MDVSRQSEGPVRGRAALQTQLVCESQGQAGGWSFKALLLQGQPKGWRASEELAPSLCGLSARGPPLSESGAFL